MRKLAVGVWFAATVFGQQTATPAFEVASVRINRQEPFVGYTLEAKGETLTIRNVNFRVITAWAYNVQWSQIAGPAWIDSSRFDIVAKAGKALPEREMRPMLQALLAERFHFASHLETREVEALALTVPKGGHKMTASHKTEPASHQDPARGMVVEGVSLAEFCENMSHERNSVPIVDMTGLTGRFDFTLNIPKYVQAMRARATSGERPTMTEADFRLALMEEMIGGELGLKVTPRRAPVEFRVIDRADQNPTEN